jgi:hypothetical protein
MIASLNLLSWGRGGKNARPRQRAVQLRHRLQLKRFGARLNGNARRPCLGELNGRVACSAKIVLQSLPLLGEALPQEAVKSGWFHPKLRKSWREMQSQCSGIDLWRRRECRWGQGKKVLDLSIHLRSRRKQAVIANARSSGDAIGHLALHHDDGTLDQSRAPCSKELKQDVRSDVVRQVPNHVHSFAFWNERSKVGLEDVALDNLYLGLVAKPEGQFGRERRVEFKSNQTPTAPGKDLGNRTVARADLNNRAFTGITKSVDDGMAGTIIHKKVLAEFWLTFHLHPMACDFSHSLID